MKPLYLKEIFTKKSSETVLDSFKYNHPILLHNPLMVVLGLLNLFINSMYQLVKVDALLLLHHLTLV